MIHIKCDTKIQSFLFLDVFFSVSKRCELRICCCFFCVKGDDFQPIRFSGRVIFARFKKSKHFPPSHSSRGHLIFLTKKTNNVIILKPKKLVGFVCKWFSYFLLGVFSGWKSSHVRFFWSENLPHFFYHRASSRRVSRCRWFRWHAQSIRPPGHWFSVGCQRHRRFRVRPIWSFRFHGCSTIDLIHT